MTYLIILGLISILLTIISRLLSKFSPLYLKKVAIDDSLKNAIQHWIKNTTTYENNINLIRFINNSALIIVLYTQSSNENNTLLFITVLIVFFSIKEFIAMFIIKQKNIKLIKFFLPILKIIAFILTPWNYCVKIVEKFFNHTNFPTEIQISLEEQILSLVENDETQKKSSDLEEDEKQMIKGIFNLDNTVVKEIMTPRVDVSAISIDKSIKDAKKLFIESSFSRLPIYKENIDEILGVIYAKDFLNLDNIATTSLENFIHKAIFVPESKNLDDLLKLFQIRKNHFAVVVDEYGGTAGIITIEDILEEIVGEIHDEYDDEEELEEISFKNNIAIMDARSTIADINKELEIIPDNDNYETIGGFIGYFCGRIPSKGEIVEHDLFTIEILEADQRHIEKVKLTLKQP